MKNKLLILMFFVVGVNLLQAKTVIADFESAETTPVLIGDNALVVNNPDKSGINLSNTTGVYDKIAGNWHYVTLEFANPVAIGNNNTLTFKIRAGAVGRIYAKLWNNSSVVIENWAPDYNFKPAQDKWVECTVDITTVMGESFTKLEIAALVDNEAAATVYFDDFELSNPEAGDGTPFAKFVVSESKIIEGDSVLFDAAESFDFDGTITSYDWDFGDGFIGNGDSIYHVYQTAGVYEATLLLTDNDAKTSAKTVLIYVLGVGDKFSILKVVTKNPGTYKKVEAVFQLGETYANNFDPQIVSVDALITLPDASEILVPCFYYVSSFYSKNVWVTDSSLQSWMLRFSSAQSGTHSIQLRLTDGNGVNLSTSIDVEIVAGAKTGYVEQDTANKQYYRLSSGEQFVPLGINVAWGSADDGSLDPMTLYHTVISNLNDGKANLIRYWHTPFAHQALEWSNDGFYNGLGQYSQEAAAMSDSLFNLCDELNMYIQLTIFQHGPFSENVNPMWETNPYNIVNGGFVDKAEKYFYTDECKVYTKKLLRYIIARWGYSTQLFAWELFNEVQFTGENNAQSPLWNPGLQAWHGEMSRYIQANDPFQHLRTTSANDNQVIDMDSIPELDILQYHLYSDNILNDQFNSDNNFKDELENAAIINGEYGTNDNATMPIDAQRKSIWNGLMTSVPHLMWSWGNYVQSEWGNLFLAAGNYASRSNFTADGPLTGYNFTGKHNSKTLICQGLNSEHIFYGFAYDKTNANNIADGELSLSNIPYGYYKLEYTLPEANVVIDADSIAVINLDNKLVLPTFSKEIAFKLTYSSAYTLPIAIIGHDTIVAPGSDIPISGSQSVSASGDPLTFQWQLTLKPSGSTTTIANPTAESFTFTPDKGGSYSISLVVNDGSQLSVPAIYNIRASYPPVAVAGDDVSGLVSDFADLDGSASFDDDGDEITYLWKIISAPTGSKKSLYNFNKPVAKLKLDLPGTFVVTLIVSDGISESLPDTMNVFAGSVGINQQNLDNEISVYPNPFNLQLLVEIPIDKNEILELGLLDLQGRIIGVFQQTNSNTDNSVYQLNTETIGLLPGVYFVRCISKNKVLSYKVSYQP